MTNFSFFLCLSLAGCLFTLFFPSYAIDPVTTLECHRRQYSYKVQQTDSEGRTCWDHINVMSCWGRCDSNEIADWKFPYKKSHHPVCLHSSTQENKVSLRNCDAGVDPETKIYTFQEAASCSCSFCRSSEASCEGLRYRGARRAPRQIKKIFPSKRFKKYPIKSPELPLGDMEYQQKELMNIVDPSKDIQQILIDSLKSLNEGDLASILDRKPKRKEITSISQIPFVDSTYSGYLSLLDPTFKLDNEETSIEEDITPPKTQEGEDATILDFKWLQNNPHLN